LVLKREFLSTNEVAALLGISPFTIRRYIQLRKLKALKLEGSYRVRRSDLRLFLKAREIETEEELAAMGEAGKQSDSPRRAPATHAARSASNPPIEPSKKSSAHAQTRAGRSQSSRKTATRKRKEQ
jgi:excisionase family DNA binding protein